MESSTEFFECEKDKILNMSKSNIEMLSNLKKFIEILDQVENITMENIILQLDELNEIQNMSKEMFDIFKIICQNLFEAKIQKT